ncbi:beta-ketoacyl synthase : Polyketide synthase family protein OS=Singulisphaera acidiphila (strain ATCC BAA-1392 / DSM 18658 / VKM B-2454 / MOB10) GN=Sinac_5565 PE=4 SV=1: Acyl_transf_1: PS-DH [Gemmataceae bacterium]|nr:beta-ketoacyl synthase : Polyketide synthase family protein OS=Singulisphaera acidiphila (strain ATCC BAA-1392 / DSM 18658 / VKM B-2454 / MOB10) GN=Sinac_5565 PE=4 SV=1: Acyl_transf_1: PS-DH [Gemmataceae bacterium]VTU00502.1 beta-ketoacyl synthase : Polyketide synthase family protein OS=Singulisphaera acidiphila (strain ATCC BAA-1392 / DSM 18658 / VKM B-2454 / MOB10) GN=Sinac_5565 PE=4 SV=1: Acyl_transf_1: PS-DH [Gemmataceae bacterium]
MVVIAPSPSPQSAAPVVGWDSEAFVVCGADRADLRERSLALAADVERHPGAPLAEIAARLAADLQPGGVRLAVVASSPTDLVAKLRRGADRVADPKCKQVRDTNGLYFFETPLATQGTLALLFPGEGAQYPGMLADLCGVFPEVEDAFSWCDRLAAESGRASLRAVLHPAPEDKAAAEIELRQLGPSIFGVLLADLAITRVLQNLQLPVSAVAGHSAGELAALLAAGAMDSTAMIGPSLIETTDLMQRLEDEAGGDVALLAVGAGRAAVEEVAANVARGGVVVAMDNCPHQSVAVGPTHLVAAVEAALLERGLVCERLPFRRPYHTPLFEPWMPQFRELFARIPFSAPHTPIYSCSTGRPFPPDPAAIRDLAVNHWVSPVEFTRMIETMYADGVRIFVEAGPRGNLSAFAEDVLRGRPCAVIPANVFRKSGPTQVNHMVAQLAAHHVPLNLAHLYAGRVADAGASGGRESPGELAAPHTGGLTSPARQDLPDPVMDGYFSVMEQFLDVQREVVEAFFTGHAANGHISVLPEFFPEPDTRHPTPDSAVEGLPFCFLGDAVQFEAGREAVFRRTLDLHEDLYVDDHTLGGRGVSRTDPRQNGLPVLPMTFSLEAMASAASALVPGKVVIALRDVRLFRWVPYENEPTTFEVRVSVASVNAETGVVEVKANVRDLGNSFVADAANKPSSEATVVLADRFPEPPEPQPFVLSDEAPCDATVEELRRNMFHGPLFQMLRSLDRYGKEGIEGTLEVQPRDGWFRSNPNPRTVIDPVLVDAAMHILGAWHLEQPDWSGRILLPIGMKSLEFFGPLPEVGSRLLVRGYNEEETARQARNGVELFDTQGRPWFRLSGAGYWRFYLPFGDTNFFGPKDQYFLSSRVTEAEASAASRCYFLDPPLDLQQPALRASGVRVSMTPTEQAAFLKVRGTEAEKSDWFFSRLVAKDAARALWNKGHASGTFPADMESEVRGNVVLCRQRAEPTGEAFPLAKFAVAKGRVAAFAATAERFGVGLVLVKKGDAEDALRLDAARLAAADALGVPAAELTATTGATPGGILVAHAGKKLRVQTARHKDVVIGTTVCEVEPA